MHIYKQLNLKGTDKNNYSFFSTDILIWVETTRLFAGSKYDYQISENGLICMTVLIVISTYNETLT